MLRGVLLLAALGVASGVQVSMLELVAARAVAPDADSGSVDNNQAGQLAVYSQREKAANQEDSNQESGNLDNGAMGEVVPSDGPQAAAASSTGFNSMTGGATMGATGATGATGAAGASVSPDLRAKLTTFASKVIAMYDFDSSGKPAQDSSCQDKVLHVMSVAGFNTSAILKEALDLSPDLVAEVSSLPAQKMAAEACLASQEDNPSDAAASQAEAAVMQAQNDRASQKYSHVLSAEMVLSGYDRDSFGEVKDVFIRYLANSSNVDVDCVSIDNFATKPAATAATPANSSAPATATALRRRLLAAGPAPATAQLKVSFTIKFGSEAAAKQSATSINGVTASVLRAAGLTAVTAVQVTKAAEVSTWIGADAADFAVQKAKEEAQEAQAAAAAAGTPAKDTPKPKKRPLKLRKGAGHWAWVLDHHRQWTLSGRAEAFWKRQQEVVRALVEKQEAKKAKAATPAAPAATGAAATAF